MAHSKELTNLDSVNLMRTNVTDAGPVHLTGLTQLQRLDLRRTSVTDAGAKKFQAVLRKCRITR